MVGVREKTEMTNNKRLASGEIDMGWDLISLDLDYSEVVHILENPIVRDRALDPLLRNVRPNPREWMESCYCLSKWRFD